MLKYGTCGKKMDIDLDKMKTTNAKENKDEDRFFFDKEDDMGGDKEKEKDDSEEISQHVRLYI